jgi:transposase
MTSYATGLTNDFDAVHAGLSLPHNSGVIEGRVTDLKLIKRQMGGRARIRLLRKRVILVAHSRRSNKPAPITDDPWTINAHENLV